MSWLDGVPGMGALTGLRVGNMFNESSALQLQQLNNIVANKLAPAIVIILERTILQCTYKGIRKNNNC